MPWTHINAKLHETVWG